MKKSCSKLLGYQFSKTPTSNRTPTTQFHLPEQLNNNKKMKTCVNIYKDPTDIDDIDHLDLQKEFDELSVKSEIFTILKSECNNLRGSNISGSTAISRNGMFNSNEGSDDIFEEECQIPVRSSNPLYRQVKGGEDDAFVNIDRFGLEMLK